MYELDINILYSSDENYVKHAAASLISLLKNNSDFNNINIFYLENNLSKVSKEKLREIVEGYDRKIIFIDSEQLCKKMVKKDDFPLAGYARLFISQIADIDKILYLDCDTIINSSLKSLWETEIESYLLAGVQDNPALYMVEAIGMDRNDRYINSGVMLINLKKWRETNLEDRFVEFIKSYRGKVPHHDQGVINGVCKDNILILNPKYNFMPQFIMHTSKQIKKLYNIKSYYTQAELDNAVHSPVIIHFITKFYGRPWEEKCTHPMKNTYINNLKDTSFEVELDNGKQDLKIKLRKFVFKNTPFIIFYLCERTLDFKRKRSIYSELKI